MDSPPRRAAYSISEFGQLVSTALESQEHFKPALDFAFMEPRYSESRFSLDTLDSDPVDAFPESTARPDAPRKLFRSLRALVTGKRASEPPYRSPVVVARDIDPFTQSTHSSAFAPFGAPYHDGLEDFPPPSPTLFARSCTSLDSLEDLDRRASIRSASSAGATSSLSTTGSSSACTDRSAPPLSPLFFAPSDPDASRRAYSDVGHGEEDRAAEFDADPFAKDTVQIMPRTPPRRISRHPRSLPGPLRALPSRTPVPTGELPACPLPDRPHGGCGDWTLSLPLPSPASLDEVHARTDVNAALNRDVPCSRWFPSPPPSPSPVARRRGALRPSTSSGVLQASTPPRSLRGSSSAISLPPPIMRRPSRASSTTSSKKRVAFAVGVITPVQELKAPIWEPSTPPEESSKAEEEEDLVPLQELVQALKEVAVQQSTEIVSTLENALPLNEATKTTTVSFTVDDDPTRRPDSPFPLLQPKRSKLQAPPPEPRTAGPPSPGAKLTRSKPVSPRHPTPSRAPASPTRKPILPQSRIPSSPRTSKSPRSPSSPRSVTFPAARSASPSPRPGRSPYGRPSSRLAIRSPAPRRASPVPPLPKISVPPMPPVPRTPPRTRLAGRKPTTPGTPAPMTPGTPSSMSSASFHTARSSFETEMR